MAGVLQAGLNRVKWVEGAVDGDTCYRASLRQSVPQINRSDYQNHNGQGLQSKIASIARRPKAPVFVDCRPWTAMDKMGKGRREERKKISLSIATTASACQHASTSSPSTDRTERQSPLTCTRAFFRSMTEPSRRAKRCRGMTKQTRRPMKSRYLRLLFHSMEYSLRQLISLVEFAG